MNNLALVTSSHSISYESLNRLTEKQVSLLYSLGVRAGQVIWIEALSNIFTVVSLRAAHQLGACVFLVDPQLTDADLAELVERLCPSIYLYTVNALEKYQLSQLVGLPSGENLAPRINHEREGRRIPEIAMVQRSSGTTGQSKLICISRAALDWRATAIAEILPLTKRDRTLCTVPLSHSHGVDCLLMPTLRSGGCVYLFEPKMALPFRIVKWLEQHQISFFSSVPQMYQQINLCIENGMELKFLRHAFCGSAALTPQIAIDFLKLTKVVLCQGYGLAEVGVACVDLNRSREKSFTTIGSPILQTQAKISSEQELLLKSPGAFSYYLDDKEATRNRFDGDWIRTGDLVTVNSDQEYCILGRSSEMINVSGQKVEPREIEDRIKTIAPMDCCVLGKMDSDRGEIPVAFLEKKNLSSEQVERFTELIRRDSGLATYKVPREIIWLDYFPRSSLGKVLRQDLRLRLEAPSEKMGDAIENCKNIFGPDATKSLAL